MYVLKQQSASAGNSAGEKDITQNCTNSVDTDVTEASVNNQRGKNNVCRHGGGRVGHRSISVSGLSRNLLLEMHL